MLFRPDPTNWHWQCRVDWDPLVPAVYGERMWLGNDPSIVIGYFDRVKTYGEYDGAIWPDQ